MSTKQGTKAFNFDSECDEILRTIASRPYRDTLMLVDALERRATLALPDQDARLSCADLRLDAALATGQQASECEARYNDLVQCGADTTLRLLKACVLVREVREVSTRTVAHLRSALADADSKAPIELVETAKQLLTDMTTKGLA
jgi:hypothetical protein